MFIQTEIKPLAWALSRFRLGGLRFMYEYKVCYYFNQDYGEMWMPADTEDQAMAKVEKRLGDATDEIMWLFSAEVREIRKVKYF